MEGKERKGTVHEVFYALIYIYCLFNVLLPMLALHKLFAHGDNLLRSFNSLLTENNLFLVLARI